MRTTSTWPKVFAYAGLSLIGLVMAFYSTTIATGGIAARALGRPQPGNDLVMAASAMLLAGVAMMAVFGYRALIVALAMVRAHS